MEIVLHNRVLCQGRIARFVESPEKKFPFLIIKVALNPVRASGLVFRDEGNQMELLKDVPFDIARKAGTFYLPDTKRPKAKKPAPKPTTAQSGVTVKVG